MQLLCTPGVSDTLLWAVPFVSYTVTPTLLTSQIVAPLVTAMVLESVASVVPMTCFPELEKVSVTGGADVFVILGA